MYMYVQLLPLLHSMLATVATVASIAMALYIYYYTIYQINTYVVHVQRPSSYIDFSPIYNRLRLVQFIIIILYYCIKKYTTYNNVKYLF